MNNKVSSFFFHIILLTPFIFLVNYIHQYFVDIYFWDTYSLIPNLIEDLNLQWLFTLHNEHWIVFTKLIYWIQYKFFEGSKVLVISLQVIIQVFILYFIYFKIKDEINDMNLFYQVLIFLPISIMLSSLQLAGIWHWGFAIQQQFTVLFFILSIETYYNFIRCNKLFFYLLSLIFSIFAALSSANGLIAIITIFIISFFYTKKLFFKISNLFLMLVLCIIYINQYLQIEKSDSVEFAIDIKKFILYFLSFLGAPFSTDNIIIAVSLGIISISLLGIACIVIYQKSLLKDLNKITYFLFILILPLSSAILATIGRSKYGIEQSLDSRYIIFSSLFWIILFVILILLLKENRLIKKTFKIWIVLLSIIFGYLYVNTTKQYKVYTAIQEDLKVQYLALQNNYFIYEPYSVFTQLYLDSKQAYENLDKLSKNNYHVFLERNGLIGKNIKDIGYKLSSLQIANKNIEEVKVYSLPEVNGELKLAYEFKGWAQVDHDLLDKKILVINNMGIIVGIGELGFSRKDVSQYLKVNENNYGIRGFILPENDKIDEMNFFILSDDELITLIRGKKND